MPTNGQAVKIAHYTRSKFNSLTNKDSATIYYVEESDGKIKQYIGNTHVASDVSYNDLTNKPTIPTIPSVMTTEEGNTGTATTQRTINAANLKDIILYHSPAGARPSTWGTVSGKPSWIGNSKPTYDLGEISETTTYKRVTQSEKNTWNDKQSALGYTPENIANKRTSIRVSGADDTSYVSELGVKTYVDGLIGSVYRPAGDWNANTNSPTLSNNTPANAGKVYRVSVAGTRFGFTFAVGDKLAFNESGVISKWDNVDDVTSVAGKTGAVVLTASDVGARASDWTPTWSQVSSKPSWIGNSKPTYDLGEISETTTYKRVTQTEKDTWNNKVDKTYLSQGDAGSLDIGTVGSVGFINIGNPDITFTTIHNPRAAYPSSPTLYNDSILNYKQTRDWVTANTRSNTWTPTWSQVSGKPNVIIEGDSRLTNARPASDVSAWAKKSSLAIGDIPTGTTGSTVALGNHTHSTATTSVAGFMSSADKTKLDGISAGAQPNVGTNLSQGARNTTTLRIDSSTGNNLTLPAVTTSLAGLMTSTDKTKLDGIAAGAQVNRAIATTAQAQAGTDDTTVMTPLKVKQAITANGGGGGVEPIKSGSFQTGIPIGDYAKYSIAIVNFNFSGYLWTHVLPLPDTANGTKTSEVAVVDAGWATQVKVSLSTTTSFDPNYSVLTVSVNGGAMFSSVVIM